MIYAYSNNTPMRSTKEQKSQLEITQIQLKSQRSHGVLETSRGGLEIKTRRDGGLDTGVQLLRVSEFQHSVLAELCSTVRDRVDVVLGTELEIGDGVASSLGANRADINACHRTESKSSAVLMVSRQGARVQLTELRHKIKVLAGVTCDHWPVHILCCGHILEFSLESSDIATSCSDDVETRALVEIEGEVCNQIRVHSVLDTKLALLRLWFEYNVSELLQKQREMKTYTSKGGTSLLEGCLGAEDSVRDKSIVRKTCFCHDITCRDLEFVQRHPILLETLDREFGSIGWSRLRRFSLERNTGAGVHVRRDLRESGSGHESLFE